LVRASQVALGLIVVGCIFIVANLVTGNEELKLYAGVFLGAAAVIDIPLLLTMLIRDKVRRS
jgi:hypothetical protein